MMVAIAILAVASSAVFFSNSEALTTQVKLEEQTIAQWALSNQVAYYRLSRKVKGNTLYSADFQFMDNQRITIGGIDLEIQTRRSTVNMQFLPMEQVTFSAYRIVDDRLLGPIRSYHAVFEY